MSIRSFSTAVLLIASMGSSPAAQTIPPQTLAGGTRIRVSLKASPDLLQFGIVDTLKNGWLTWRPVGDSSLTVPLNAISTLEVSQGRHSKAGKGALTGAAIVGFLSFAAAASNTGGTDRLDDFRGKLTGAQVVWLTAGGTAIGAGVGALIGSMSHSENWVDVPIKSFGVAPVSLNRFSFGISLRF